MDDSDALVRCLDQLSDAGDVSARTLSIPAGIYLIDKTVRMPRLSRGTTIAGSGTFTSIVILGRNFSGDLFSWSEAWSATYYGATRVDVAHDRSGPTVTGLKIVGSREASGRQAALAFYDRNDFVLLRDLEMDYINGPCITIGHTLQMPQAYMRESSFYNVKCWNSGSDAEPAVEIGSTTTEGSDATNELDFYKLAIYAAKNVGLLIRNPTPFSATRKLRFFGIRVEYSGGDDIDIAPEPDKGQVAEVDFFDLSAMTSGGAALRIGGASGKQPFAIAVHGGLFGPGNKIGVEIDNGRLIDIELSHLDAPVVLGANAGGDISIHGNGSEYDWKFEGTKKPGEGAAPLNLRAPYGLYGLPSAGARVGAAALKGQSVGGRPVRLTMDGQLPNAYNCFNPSYSQMFNFDIQVMAVDRAAPNRFFAWHMPLAVLSAWTGAASAKIDAGEPMVRGLASASVSIRADSIDGCLDLTFEPSPGDKDTWDVTAAIHFARAP